MVGRNKKTPKPDAIVDIQHGKDVDYKIELDKEMLSLKGKIIPSTIKGLSFKLDKRYVLSKLKYILSEQLGLSKHDAMAIVMQAYSDKE